MAVAYGWVLLCLIITFIVLYSTNARLFTWIIGMTVAFLAAFRLATARHKKPMFQTVLDIITFLAFLVILLLVVI